MTSGRRPPLTLLVCTGVVLAGCAEHEFHPPDREEQVAEAERLYQTLVFDTIEWEDPDARAFAGNGVFSAKCRQCHGPLGEGGTAYAEERGLDVPSLVQEEWEYAGEIDAVRRRIFTGHPEGMPTWGVGGVTLREIDATAFYILERLRPEVLGGEGSSESSGGTG